LAVYYYNGGISPGPTVLEYKNFMQPIGGLNMHSKSLDLFSFKFGGWGVAGVGELFFFSFFLCSQHVPFKFPMDSKYVA